MKTSTRLLGLGLCRRLCHAVALVMLAVVPTFVQAQDAERRRGTGQDDGSGRKSFNPQDMQARMLATLRERMGVASDEEWAIIAERISKVSEARRAAAGPMAGMGFRGPGGPGGGDNERGRPPARTGGSPEMQSLQSAVADKLPEAEIKARLAKLRETRKANEKKLEQAQEDLRAVLTVRQEALLVMMGLLP